MSDSRSLVVIRSRKASSSCQIVSIDGGIPEEVRYPGATYWEQLATSPTGNGYIAGIVSGDTLTPRAVAIGPDRVASAVAYTATNEVAENYLCASQSISWTSQGVAVHGLYYPPNNPDYVSDGRPPLVVLVHGGPTGHVSTAYNGQIQFFTSRGYAVLAVNYRGSTGYGRQYRKALEGLWGVVDVADVVSGALYCVEQGWVNARQLVIMGGSAGGYTVLKTLADHPGIFKAGVSLFGVSNLFTLAAETHKFESRYLDSMLGPLPDASAIYHDRSPIFLADSIKDALAIFQGDEDVVVPRNQADSLVEILRKNGVPHFYEVYPGEGHGWRGAQTIERFYTSLQKFLVQYVIYG
jgi:dipeptidyl aminopeptidase/acylaminoacyl peptidase